MLKAMYTKIEEKGVNKGKYGHSVTKSKQKTYHRNSQSLSHYWVRKRVMYQPKFRGVTTVRASDGHLVELLRDKKVTALEPVARRVLRRLRGPSIEPRRRLWTKGTFQG